MNNNDDAWHHGRRSELVSAVHADDPEAVAKCLEVCSLIDRNTLLCKQSEIPFNNWAYQPWSNREAEQSQVKAIDNEFCRQLIRLFFQH